MSAPSTVVREYKDTDAFQRDAARLSRDGYTVAAQSEQTRRSGCLRIIMLGGIGALIWKPKPRLVVTYQRPAA